MPDINMQVFEEAKRNQLVTEIDIQTQVALDDYQVQLSDIANPTQSQDNVVIDRNGEFLPHWNESLDFDTWVKMSMEVAGKRIMMLRGNSTVGSVSDGDDVFIQYKGLSTSQYKAANVQSPPCIFEFRFSVSSFANVNNVVAIAETAGVTSDDYAYFTIRNYLSNDIRTVSANEGAFTGVWRVGTPKLDANYKIVLDGTNAKYYKDDVLRATHTTNVPTSDKMGISIEAFNDADATCHFAYIHKYTATEPTWTADGTPQNIVTALKSLGRAG